MASNRRFFDEQTALTFAKTKIFESYIKGYLPKLLMSQNQCLIADLFCGPGKNGGKLGSPLILIETLNYILSSQQLKAKRNIKVFILFNDVSRENINNLKSELEKIEFDKTTIELIFRNKPFEELLGELIRKPERLKIPKFFFLDPFSYAIVKMQHLKDLMNLAQSEVLLFIPVFHSYRFSSSEVFNEDHKTRKFIEEFTSKGISDYANVDDFLSSIRGKLLESVSLQYIRPILLDGGGSKNSLLLLTKHQKGMLLMNKIAFSNTDDGNRIKVISQDQASIFGAEEGSMFYSNYVSALKEFLQNKEVTNMDIVDFTIKEGCLPKHAKKEIKELHDIGKIEVYENNTKIIDSRMWNIADEINKMTIIKWVK